ncbi:CLUMA_CG012296, isoform A [Clunio marinus]|uniref:CLUMA_CG012296, isoform A n=1 Tax=Clunio marinus TaxID=568069 RepID=A0A1J1IHZ1_9DIPT|nr:CLUMA_CG012296, isoform A [Clunio marinus]
MLALHFDKYEYHREFEVKSELAFTVLRDFFSVHHVKRLFLRFIDDNCEHLKSFGKCDNPNRYPKGNDRITQLLAAFIET